MKKQIQHHPFADSGETDGAPLKPQRICATCLMPERNQRHTLPSTTEAARQLDARIIGETKEHQTT